MRSTVRLLIWSRVILLGLSMLTLVSGVAQTGLVQLCCSNITVSADGAFTTYITVQPTIPSALRVSGRVMSDWYGSLGEVVFSISANEALSRELVFQNAMLTNGAWLRLTGVVEGEGAVLSGISRARLVPPIAVRFPESPVDISDEGVARIVVAASEHPERLRVMLRQISGERRDASGWRLDPFLQEVEFSQEQREATIWVPNLASEAEFVLEQRDGVLVDMNSVRATFQPSALYFKNNLQVTQGSSVIVEVHRGGDPTQAVSVDFRTRDMTAKAGVDYEAQSGTVKFASGERTGKIEIALIHEAREMDLGLIFAVDLSDPVNTTLIESSATILFARTIRFLSDSYELDPNGEVTLRFGVSPPLTEAMNLELEFSVTSWSTFKQVRAPAGQSEFSQKLSLPDNSWPFRVSLDFFATNAAACFPSSAEVRPHGWSPDVSVIRVTADMTSEGYPAYFHLTRDGPVNEPLDLTYSTQDITARAGTDYVSANGVIHFPAGVDRMDLAIDTLKGSVKESLKNFSLSFSDLPADVRVLQSSTAKILATGHPYNLWIKPGIEGASSAGVSISTDGLEISFDYRTVEGTAKGGMDFMPVDGSFTNVSSAEIEIPILDDFEAESPESFTLNIVETFPERRTNSFEIMISDNEIPLNHDSLFKSPVFYNYVTGSVLEDDRIAMVEWPKYLDLLDKNGARLSRTELAGASLQESDSLASVTPEAEVLVALGSRLIGEPGLLRVKGDGHRDASFHPELPEGAIVGVASASVGKTYVVMKVLSSAGWNIFRLNYDGSRDPSFAAVQVTGWGERVDRVSLAGPETIEIITDDCRYKYCSYNRLFFRNGAMTDALFSGGGPYVPYPLSEVYVGENGQKILPDGQGILYRRNADGTIDPSLKTGRFDGWLTYLGTQSDGKVIFLNSRLYPATTLVRIGPGTTLVTNVVVINSDDSYRASEAAREIQVDLMRGGDSSGPISVRAKTEDGTAKAGLDYEPLDKEITFAPGEVGKKVVVRILQDALGEGEEDFYLRISEPSIGTMVDDSSVALTIIDDDYIALRIGQELNGQWFVYADNRTGRNIELQASDDGTRTWKKVAGSETYFQVPIKFEGRQRLYRAVLRD